MIKNDILNRPFKDVYDEVMIEIDPISLAKTLSRNWICRNTTKASGHSEIGYFVTVMDFLNDFNSDSYSGRRGYGPATNEYVHTFAEKLKEIVDSD